MAGLRYRICRAFRRMARLLPVASLALARRLGLLTALPCAPAWLPDPDLSETLRHVSVALIQTPETRTRRVLRALRRLHAIAGGAPRRFRLA